LILGLSRAACGGRFVAGQLGSPDRKIVAARRALGIHRAGSLRYNRDPATTLDSAAMYAYRRNITDPPSRPAPPPPPPAMMFAPADLARAYQLDTATATATAAAIVAAAIAAAAPPAPRPRRINRRRRGFV